MATAQEIAALYDQILDRTPDPAGLEYWANSGLSAAEIASAISASPEAKVNNLYNEYLGREADAAGAQYWQNQIAGGANIDDVIQDFTRAADRDYTNFITQAITSAYGLDLARRPEQEGYQYWASRAAAEGLSAKEIQDLIRAAAVAEQTQRGITGGNTQFYVSDLEADPWGGRFATRSIYDIPTNEADRINISYINGIPVQFVNPVTQQQYITKYGQDQWNAVAGDETFSKDRVIEAMNRAVEAGSMTIAERNATLRALTGVTEPEQVRQILGIPQGAVIIDPKYGQQIGEDNDLKLALAEAAKRQAVLSAQDPGYYQASDILGQAYLDAGLPWAFMSNTYLADTMMTQANKLTKENLSKKLNEFFNQIQNNANGRFGGINDLQTPLTGQYYSETGLQPGFTPFGTEGTMFRSGVAGYMPQADLPTGFTFGSPLVNATFQQYRPGAFQPEGVTTGGFITGYTQAGQPIYSTYANPNVNVGGATSTLNPLNASQLNQLSDLQNLVSQLQANPILNPQQSGGG